MKHYIGSGRMAPLCGLAASDDRTWDPARVTCDACRARMQWAEGDHIVRVKEIGSDRWVPCAAPSAWGHTGPLAEVLLAKRLDYLEQAFNACKHPYATDEWCNVCGARRFAVSVGGTGTWMQPHWRDILNAALKDLP